jgi:putative endonuclease
MSPLRCGHVTPNMPAWLYILRLESDALYVGATKNLEQRWSEHRSGRACRTTACDRPRAIAYVESHASFAAARRREAQIKRWTRGKKEALVRGDSNSLRALSRRRKRGVG